MSYGADAIATFGDTTTQSIQLFLDRVVDTSQKVTGTSAGLRHVDCVVGSRNLIAKSPDAPGDPLLVEHVEMEIDVFLQVYFPTGLFSHKFRGTIT